MRVSDKSEQSRLPQERMLTVRETCELLGVSRAQINKWMLEGALTAIYVGRERRFPIWYLREFQGDQLGVLATKIQKNLDYSPKF